MRLLYATDVRTSAITCPLLRAEVERAPDRPWAYYRAEVDGVVVEVLLRVHLGRVRGGVTVIPVPDESRLRPQGETTC